MNGQLTNITDEPPYTEPVLQVCIFGLGALWFDTASDCADFGFIEIQENPHPLTLEICENGQIIHFEEVSKNQTIYISGSSENTGMGDQYHSSNQPPDDDFRWLIDLDSHHQPPLDFMSKPEFYARLKSNVGDAIFFTEHKSHGNAVLQENGQPVNTPSPVGQVIGFRSQKEGSELRIDNGQNLLLNSQGKYTVIIRYHCTTGAAGSNPVNSDFSRIYDVIHDDGNLPRYDLVYDDYETPWISGCEMAKMTGHSQNIASIFTQNTSLSLAQMEEIAENLNYINRRLTCDVICQSVVFGKYSRTVS